jgi:Asp-tRNA(Asn)/Glu-tRNA(Gln) amidotransferase B subunit
MLHSLKNIFIILFAFFILLLGNGINIIDFCCQKCDTSTPISARLWLNEVETINSCHEVHHSDHEKASSCCDDNVPAEESNSCQFTRYVLDEATYSSTNISLNLNLLVAVIHSCGLTFNPQTDTFKSNLYTSQDFVPDTGRNILVRKCVLTI